MPSVLVSGGAGYIGSHVVRQLLAKGNTVTILDNLSRGHIESVPREAVFINADLNEKESLSTALAGHRFDAAIHFAAFAYVGESVEHPDLYYQNNVVGSFNFINALMKNNVTKIVFSSTCSIYGNPQSIPISEQQSPNPINPYAWTKYIIERILADYEPSFGLHSVCLRYFNAAGASFSGGIGESHNPEPHLIPLVLYAAMQKREQINVFGDDYPTPDGTCIRDYIHVDDLADAHIRALDYLLAGGRSSIINLGTGVGNSVKEVISTAEAITGMSIPVKIIGRRSGDPAVLVADNQKARETLGWQPKYDLKDIISSAWDWHRTPKY